MRAPWEWRKAAGGWWADTDPRPERFFHAYDVNGNAACAPWMGLGISCEEPNEGSQLCPKCLVVATTNPSGRDKKVIADG